MSDFTVSIVSVALFCVVAYLMARHGAARRLRRLQQEYGAENVFFSRVDQSYIALDPTKKRVALSGRGGSSSTGTSMGVYDFAQISSAEIVSNGTTLARVSRTEEVGSPSTALLSRPAAAEINSESMRHVGLRVNVNDSVYPTFLIQFVYEAIPSTEKPAAEERPELTALRSFYDRLRTAIRQTEAVSAEAGLSAASPSGPCIVSIVSARNTIDAINAIRRLRPDLDLVSARNLVESMPAVVMTGVDPQEAERLRNSLALQGIGVSII
ncbi:ribosomal protein L7/L12 [Granulicella sp. S156]|jgi:ribosomal protein L7/L12|uniref:ribosomal protein L7/L12 n=1 Tax=Granulicella sp. S156 TaxID=1747224 RepID=UPI00131E43E3|nr:ribosomal protein L7/L12 [Granulicella sp. S156]